LTSPNNSCGFKRIFCFIKNRRLSSAAFLILIASILIEVFFFNFRHFESLGFLPISSGEATDIQGMTPLEDGNYIVGESGNSRILFKPNGFVKNIKISVSSLSKGYMDFFISFVDEGNSEPFETEVRRVVPGVERTRYHRTHFSGIAGEVAINLINQPFDTVSLDEISFNQTVPFNFSIFRFCFVYFLLFIPYCFRPDSKIYEFLLMDKKHKFIKISTVFILAVLIAVFFRILTTSNSFWVNPSRDYDNQYQRLSESILDGRADLKEDPPEWLVRMQNPYDTNARLKLELEYGENALWDHVFFEGRYYSYFGVLPALVYHIPFYLISGDHAPTYFGIFLCLTVFSFFSFLLFYLLAKEYFDKTPFVTYIFITLIFVFSSGAVYIAHRPDFYSFPIALSMALTVGGLCFWLISKASKKGHSLFFTALGSFFIALNALSRPQFLISAFLFLPIFYDKLIPRYLFSKRSLTFLLSSLFPFILVAVSAGYYNYIRFGNVLDFGANYNLTSNDMTVRGFVANRIPLGLFTYLLQPVDVDFLFPYIKPTSVTAKYLGVTIKEPTFGGLFAISSFSWLSMLTFIRSDNPSADKTPKRLAIASIIAALILIIADTQMAGILQRYFSDFSWLILLSASIAAMEISNSPEKSHTAKTVIRTFLTLSLILCILYQLSLSFIDITHTLSQTEPEKFYSVSSLFEFLS